MKMFYTTNPRSLGNSGFILRYYINVPGLPSGDMKVSVQDGAVAHALVEVLGWSCTREMFNQLTGLVSKVWGQRPWASMQACAEAEMRKFRSDVFTPRMTRDQVFEAFLVLCDVHERLAQAYDTIEVRGVDLDLVRYDAYYQEDDGSCYDVAVRE
jgi:hypothetical protein